MKKQKKPILVLLISLLFASCTPNMDASESESTQLSDGSWYAFQRHTDGNGIDLVFMGDGYTATEIAQGKYVNDLQKAIEGFFEVQPYKAYQSYFNVYIVGAVSAESGIGINGVAKNTKFSAFHGEGTHMEAKNSVCFEYARKAPIAAIEKTVITLVANSTKYGGTCHFSSSGWAIAICPSDADNYLKPIVQHEAGGHGFAKLADEYYSLGTEISDEEKERLLFWQNLGFYRNVDITNDPSEVLWKDLIGIEQYMAPNAVVGLFEGGYYNEKGVWRPEINSCMVNNVPYFNAPSRAAIIKRIHELAGESFSMEWFIENDIIESSPTAKSFAHQVALPPLAPPVIYHD
ncbi:MAG: M64 family metallopeptidase [Bacteroidales bacterium]|nr:M64 family metallopeptidase [Bacteroidales bacterium]